MKLLILTLALSLGAAVHARDASMSSNENQVLSADEPGLLMLDSIVKESEIGTDVTAAESLDTMIQGEEQTATPEAMTTEGDMQTERAGGGMHYGQGGRYHGGGWYRGGDYYRNRYGYRRGRCWNGSVFGICFGRVIVRIGGGRYGYPRGGGYYGHGYGSAIACFARNGLSGMVFRAQAPAAFYSAANLQYRAINNCRVSSRYPGLCYAAGCRRLY